MSQCLQRLAANAHLSSSVVKQASVNPSRVYAVCGCGEEKKNNQPALSAKRGIDIKVGSRFVNDRRSPLDFLQGLLHSSKLRRSNSGAFLLQSLFFRSDPMEYFDC